MDGNSDAMKKVYVSVSVYVYAINKMSLFPYEERHFL